MKPRSKVLGVCVGVLAAVVGAALPADAIIGGTRSDPAQYPYFVRVDHSGGSCGGSVIDASWALTAAHCVANDADEPQDVDVRIMRRNDPHEYDTWDVSWEATAVILHPLWDGVQGHGHDLALIQLPYNALAPMPRVQVGAPWDPWAYAPGTVVTAMGYGRRAPDDYGSPGLLAVDTILRTDAYMAGIFGRWPAPLLIGAGTTYQTVCFGDSGGPLVLTRNGQVVQVGVVSLGGGDCNRAAGFAELAGPQLAWIASVVPSIMGRWGPCTSQYGTPGHPEATYGPTSSTGSQPDGPYHWRIWCWAWAVPVPSLSGLSRSVAAAALQNNGLQLGSVASVVDPTCNNVGAVVRQNPGAGTLLVPGSTVSITLGSRPRTPCL
jgi:V8-like Glu-specific endopeptidase